MSPNATKIFNTLWQSLSERQKDVLGGRFDSKNPLTLAALGKKYGVTRERIRQIEASGLAALRTEINAHPALLESIEKCKKYLKEAGGVMGKDDFLKYAQGVIDGLSESQLALIVESVRPFHFYREDKSFRTFFYLDKSYFKTANQVIANWTSFLRTKKDEALQGQYEDFLKMFTKKKNLSANHVSAYLAVSKKIGKSVYSDMGLTEWAEVNPRTIRDRVYLVLKKHGKPLHFRGIAETINKIGFDRKEASAPTVHNELIKDARFVLVGRGIYGLSEHGYEAGTAKEVIHRILKKHGNLKPKEIMLAVQKERFFKPNTILVNLQNKDYFERLPNGMYRVRQA